jgi:hypothetical protein
MTTLDLLRFSHEHTDLFFRPRRSNHFALDCDLLEPRQLLSVVPATAAGATTAPVAVGAALGATSTAGTAASINAAGTYESTGTGSTEFGQSALLTVSPLDDLGNVAAGITEAPAALAVATGLTSFPITALLSSTITSDETPFNNGTPLEGTVWITPVPEPAGLFHPNMTASSNAVSTRLQAPNTRGGPPLFTPFGGTGNHFGQGASPQIGSLVGDQSVAVGPEGPALMDEVEPIQAPPQAEQPPTGQPSQQQGAPAQPNGVTPGPQGVQPSQQPGAAGQPGGAAGQQGTQPPSQGAGTPGQPGKGNTPGQSGGAATSGPSGSESGASAFLTPTDPGPDRLHLAASLELIDAALPSLTSSRAEKAAEDAQAACGLSSLFGIAAVVTGGYQMALRTSGRLRRDWVLGPWDAGREAGRRYGSPSHN